MSHGDVSSTELVHLPKSGNAASNLMTAFYADHTGNAAGSESFPDTCSRIAVSQVLRMFINETAGNINLF